MLVHRTAVTWTQAPRRMLERNPNTRSEGSRDAKHASLQVLQKIEVSCIYLFDIALIPSHLIPVTKLERSLLVLVL